MEKIIPNSGVINMVSAYDELPRTPANFVALSPLRYLERAAYIYPHQDAIIHGHNRIYGKTRIIGKVYCGCLVETRLFGG
jgi:hypothetical protein